ncbi:DUF3575 domain-containing protein [Chitinophaga sp.]|uniref:DUF3575 domain-containing protein n=1 Tax=Chitinophaga sp. TaxID=1869181 RepID=UPI0031DB4114
MKRTILVCTTLLLVLQLMAQQENPTAGTKAALIRNARLKARYEKDRGSQFSDKPGAPTELGLTVGTNLFSLLEEDAGPSLFAEYRFTKHWEVGLQATWVNYTFLVNDDFPHHGFRLQPDIKFYILPKHHKIMPFVGIGGVFTQVHYKAYVTNPDDGLGGGPNFSAGKTANENKRIAGYALLFGFKKYLDGEKHRISLEVYMGIGSKWKSFPGRSAARTTYIKNQINSMNYSTDFIFYDKFDYLEPKKYPYVPICVKFGYRF